MTWVPLCEVLGTSTVVARNAPGLREALAQTDLSDEERRVLEEKLLLVDRRAPGEGR